MADIRTTWDAAALEGDWLLAPPSLDGSRELVTAVAISLFTHRTAEPDDDLPNDTSDRRGWWADHEADLIYPGATPIGSRLWLLSREKQTERTRARAEDYCREALAWMIDVGLAERVGVACAWFAPERLGATITITRGPKPSIEVRFERLWDEIV